MKVYKVILAGLAAIALLTASSCRPQGTVGASYNEAGQVGANVGLNINTNTAVNLGGTFDTNTGQWTVAVGLVFKQTPPDYVLPALKAAGAVPTRDALVWVIPPGAKATDQRFVNALVEAAKIPGGVTVTPYTQP